MHWDVIATVALFGFANAGLLIYKLGGLAEFKENTNRRLNDLETAVWPTRTATTGGGD